MDPVWTFSTEIIEMIFGFLTPKDLLRCTLVNHEWNEIIRSSTKCMSNFCMGLRGDWMDFTENDKEILTSGRKYTNVIISEGTEVYNFIHEVMSSNFVWKTVKIVSMRFKSASDLLELFKTFESTVEKLILCNVKIENFDGEEIELNMRKLKELNINYCNSELSLALLKKSQSLKTLTLGNSDEGRWTEIARTLKHCKSLKKLYTSAEWFDVLFGYEFKSLEFELKVLSVVKSSEVKHTHFRLEIEQNFIKFLEIQAKTLQKLHLVGVFRFEIFATAFQMKKLRQLSASSLGINNWSTLEYPKSSSIQFLDIACNNFSSRVILSAIIKSLPNLRRLRMRSIDQNIAQLLKENLKHLERICLVHRCPDIVKKILPEVIWQ